MDAPFFSPYTSVFFLFVFGTIIGSFLNAVSFRYGSGWSLTTRSRCMSCSKTLSPFELIPIVSFLVLRGRCSVCQTKISFQYPLVEALSGLLFVAVGAKLDILNSFFLISGHQILLFVLYTSIYAVLFLISIYDLRHKIIPDLLVGLFIILAAGTSFVVHGNTFFYADFVAGGVMACALFLLWWFSGGRAIGLGDSKLALGIGFFLGAAKGFSALALGFWIGAIVGLLLLFFAKISRFLPGIARLSLGQERLTMKSEVPLAPFLIFGAILSWWFGLDIFHINALLPQLVY